MFALCIAFVVLSNCALLSVNGDKRVVVSHFVDDFLKELRSNSEDIAHVNTLSFRGHVLFHNYRQPFTGHLDSITVKGLTKVRQVEPRPSDRRETFKIELGPITFESKARYESGGLRAKAIEFDGGVENLLLVIRFDEERKKFLVESCDVAEVKVNLASIDGQGPFMTRGFVDEAKKVYERFFCAKVEEQVSKVVLL